MQTPMNTPKTLNSILSREISIDGRLASIANGDLGDANTSYSYFNLLGDGYNIFSMQHIIQATTLTYEASNDDDSYLDTNDEMITTTVDRDMSGANNWVASSSDATVTVTGGKLAVVAGAAGTGAKLPAANFSSGFLKGKRYTIGFDISLLSAGKVKIYAGDALLAVDLANGNTQTVTVIVPNNSQDDATFLRFVADTAAATFSLDNITVKGVTATWTDITTSISGDAAITSYTTTGAATRWAPLPWARLRVKRLTTNATNSLKLILARMRA